MNKLNLRSSYLLASTPAARVKRRLWLGLWRRSLPQRSWRFKTLAGILCWGLMLAAGTYTQGTNQEPAFLTAASPGSALAASSSKSAIATLGVGPTGQLMPPGTMASYGTYRNNYSAGQCTWYVASRRPVPGNWGNARTWMGGAQRAGWATGSVPAIGAIAWTPAGYYGHVALVVEISGSRVLVSEMNYYGAFRVDQRWAPASSFAYIY